MAAISLRLASIFLRLVSIFLGLVSIILVFGGYFLTIGGYIQATDGCIFVLLHISSCYGHARPETSMIYTHVAKKDLLDIQSHFDSILLNLNKNDKR